MTEHHEVKPANIACGTSVDNKVKQAAQQNKAVLESAQKLSSRGRPEGRKTGGISQTGRDLGMTRDQVSRAAKIASLSPETKEAAKATGLDNNQSALLAVAMHKEPDQQVEAVRQRAVVPAKAGPSDPIFIICISFDLI